MPRKPQSLPRLAASLLVLGSTVFAGGAGAQEKVGDFDFQNLLNGDGRTSLSEFFGQPVLLDWWGTR
jgi:hypothetical protein